MPFTTKHFNLFLIFTVSLLLMLAPKIDAKPSEDDPLKEDVKQKERSKRTTFNIWPLLYYDRNEEKDQLEVDLLGPIYIHKENPKRNYMRLSPLYSKDENLEKGTTDIHFLYPLGKYSVRKDGDVDYRFFPLISSKRPAEDTEADSFVFFPYYRGKTKEGEKYGGLFPIYGTLKERFGIDDATFVLWPLYTRSLKRGVEKKRVLWFLYKSEKGENQKGLQLWPLFGYREKKDHFRTSFFLWPFFHSQDTGLNTENPTKARMFFPFYGYIKSPERSLTTVLWPLYFHKEDRVKDYKSDTFFIIFKSTEGKEREEMHAFPLFGYKKQKNSSKSYFLLPLYWNQEIKEREYERSTTRLLLISKQEDRVWTTKGRSSKHVFGWPLFNYRKSTEDMADTVKFTFPYIIPISSEKMERDFPILTLYWYGRDREGNTYWDFLWRLMYGEKSKEHSRFEIAYLYRYDKDRLNDHLDLSFLMGLVRYKNNDDKKSLRLFYIPWELKWGDSHSQKE